MISVDVTITDLWSGKYPYTWRVRGPEGETIVRDSQETVKRVAGETIGYHTYALKINFEGNDFLSRDEVRQLFGWEEDTWLEQQNLINLNKTLFTSLSHNGAEYEGQSFSSLRKMFGGGNSTLTLFPLETMDLNIVETRLRQYMQRKNPNRDLKDMEIEGLQQAREFLEVYLKS